MTRNDKTNGIPERSATAFQTTRWRVVLGAGQGAREHLAELCRSYWYPVYAFIRSQGVKPDEASDVTQGLFATLLEGDDLSKLNPEIGRFRSWLRTVAKNYLHNELARARRIKRGGRQSQPSFDAMTAEERYKVEPRQEGLAPDVLFDRCWAVTITRRASEQVRELYASKGMAELFARLEPTLVQDESDITDAELCSLLNRKPESVRQARLRLKGQYRQCLRWEVCGTLANPGAADDELRQLIHVLP
jgi:RNA polymerase sigma-70 factor (ECF subfamily)